MQKVCRLTQSDKLKIVYLDIFSCRSDGDFYNAFAAAVLKQTSSKWDEWVENAKLFLSRISPRISLGPDPMSDFSISLELNPKSDDIDEILQLPEKIAQKKGINIVVCIDEFQQISRVLRTQRRSKNACVRYGNYTEICNPIACSGARMHLMNELLRKEIYRSTNFGDAVIYEKSVSPIGLNISVGVSKQRANMFQKSWQKRFAEQWITIHHMCSNWLGWYGFRQRK